MIIYNMVPLNYNYVELNTQWRLLHLAKWECSFSWLNLREEESGRGSLCLMALAFAIANKPQSKVPFCFWVSAILYVIETLNNLLKVAMVKESTLFYDEL